jgi:hypothetical protein
MDSTAVVVVVVTRFFWGLGGGGRTCSKGIHTTCVPRRRCCGLLEGGVAAPAHCQRCRGVCELAWCVGCVCPPLHEERAVEDCW